MALTDRSLHCSDSFRLLRYFCRPHEACRTRTVDPDPTLQDREDALVCKGPHWHGYTERTSLAIVHKWRRNWNAVPNADWNALMNKRKKERDTGGSLITKQHRSVIAKQIKTEMVKRGLTQAQLSDFSCYDERTIRNVLKAHPVRDRTLHDICASLSIDLVETISGPHDTSLHHSAAPDLDQRAAIAVLPFVNMSGDPAQEYFSDGITEDVLTELSRFSELLVIARTSTFHYKGVSVDVRTVGRELGARTSLKAVFDVQTKMCASALS